jgi:hypothetical protein
MNYSAEEVYELVGKKDKTAAVTFKPGSEPYDLYGQYVTVQFLYTQREREEMDMRIKDPDIKTLARLKVKNLYSDLPAESAARLEKEGISTEDIALIQYFRADERNTFHSTEKRTLNKIVIPFHTQSKGRDHDWAYGFARRLVNDGIGLSPKEHAYYLAGRLYFEPEEITAAEEAEIFFTDGTVNPDVEWEYLGIIYQREEATEDDKRKAVYLMKMQDSENRKLLDNYLKETGTSLLKLIEEDIDLATKLMAKVMWYKERHFNVTGKVPIYLNVGRYLHVYMRHVEEMKVNDRFAGKTNFQYNEEDVVLVIGNVIEKINPDIQAFFERNPGKRYSRFGKTEVYFEGDYYTLHIEADGQISTFHKNRKAHEQSTISSEGRHKGTDHGYSGAGSADC